MLPSMKDLDDQLEGLIPFLPTADGETWQRDPTAWESRPTLVRSDGAEIEFYYSPWYTGRDAPLCDISVGWSHHHPYMPSRAPRMSIWQPQPDLEAVWKAMRSRLWPRAVRYWQQCQKGQRQHKEEQKRIEQTQQRFVDAGAGQVVRRTDDYGHRYLTVEGYGWEITDPIGPDERHYNLHVRGSIQEIEAFLRLKNAFRRLDQPTANLRTILEEL